MPTIESNIIEKVLFINHCCTKFIDLSYNYTKLFLPEE
jgi:hypothetical protein